MSLLGQLGGSVHFRVCSQEVAALCPTRVPRVGVQFVEQQTRCGDLGGPRATRLGFQLVEQLFAV